MFHGKATNWAIGLVERVKEDPLDAALKGVAKGQKIADDKINTVAGLIDETIGDKSKALPPKPTLIPKLLNASKDGSNVVSVTDDPLGYMRYSTNVGSVVLHMPQDISETLEASWEDGVDPIEKVLSKASGISEIFTGKKNLNDASVRGLARGAEKLLGVDDIHKSVLRRQGLVENPHSHQFFSGMSFKNYSFKHKLIAFTKEDTELNIAIVKYFKSQMKPRIDSQSERYLSYPYTFKVRFMIGAVDNAFLPPIRLCVCTNVEVSYTGSGTWSSFMNGSPVDIDLTVQFNEIELPYDNPSLTF